MQAKLMQKQGTLPQTAGDVPITYSGNRHARPRLRGRSIVLPKRFSQNDKLFPLLKGRQLLFYQRASKRTQPQVWFTGLDEMHPFVSKIDPGNWRQFRTFGEDAFYRGLKPWGLRHLEEELHIKADRQGDWWFLRLPYSWSELQKARRIVEGEELSLKRVDKKRLSGTNHRLTGILVEMDNCDFTIEGWGLWGGFLVEGALEAPHHATRKLKGPHFLVQRGKD